MRKLLLYIIGRVKVSVPYVLLLCFEFFLLYFLIFDYREYILFEIKNLYLLKVYQGIADSKIMAFLGISLDMYSFSILVILFLINFILFVTRFFLKRYYKVGIFVIDAMGLRVVVNFLSGNTVYLDFFSLIKAVKKYTYEDKLNIYYEIIKKLKVGQLDNISFDKDIYAHIKDVNDVDFIKDFIYRAVLRAIENSDMVVNSNASIGGGAWYFIAGALTVLGLYVVKSFFSGWRKPSTDDVAPDARNAPLAGDVPAAGDFDPEHAWYGGLFNLLAFLVGVGSGEDTVFVGKVFSAGCALFYLRYLLEDSGVGESLEPSEKSKEEEKIDP